MITDLAEGAPATKGWGGRENEHLHSCGEGWQFTTPRIPPHPWLHRIWAGEIVFMLHLCSTALWKLGMQNWPYILSNSVLGRPWDALRLWNIYLNMFVLACSTAAARAGVSLVSSFWEGCHGAVAFCVRVTCAGSFGMFHVLELQG